MKKLAALVLTFVLAVPALAQAGTLTILDFHTQSCPPCRAMRPEIDALRKANYPVRSIDGDRQPDQVERYGITAFPTFVIVDERGAVLATTKGYQPAKQIAELYNKVVDRRDDRDDDLTDGPIRQEGKDVVEGPDDPDRDTNPEPWKTIVRFQINDPHTRRIGFGSGTIIDSDDQDAIILTCAHLFKIEGVRQQYPPSKFPLEVTVELFDGVGRGPNKTVAPVSKLRGKVIDYDFGTDVALVRISPGRKVPYSKVVPASWQPKQGMKMTTVGCSQGHDPTAWTTQVIKPAAPGPDPSYRGMECVYSPKQGRSGGGIFTSDGYVAGVCDFASYTNTGLYARPESIHRLLDRNRLTALYDLKSSRDVLVARDKEGRVAPRGRSGGTLVADRKSDERPITIPKPELLGINEPKESYETVGIAWRPTPVSHERSTERGPRVDLGPAVDDFAADAPVTRKTSSAAPSRQFLDDRSDAAPAPAPKAKAKVVGSWSATPNSRVGVLESVGP